MNKTQRQYTLQLWIDASKYILYYSPATLLNNIYLYLKSQFWFYYLH